MANIFDDFARLSDDEIRGQIGLLESVSVTNAVIDTGKKAIKYLSSLVKSDVAGYGESDMKKLVMNKIIELKYLERTELDARLKKLLREHLGLSEDAGEDRIYVTMVRTAAKMYGINTAAAPSVLCDEVAEAYYTRFVDCVYSRLRKESAAKMAMTDAAIQITLRKMDIEKLREMAARIHVTELSGKGVGRKMRVDSSKKTIRTYIEYAGLEAFDAMELVIDTTKAGMLSLNPMDYSIMAQMTWLARNIRGSRMAVAEKELVVYTGCDEEYAAFVRNRNDIGEVKAAAGRLKSDIEIKERKLAMQNSVYERDMILLNNDKAAYNEALLMSEEYELEGKTVKEQLDNTGETAQEYRAVKARYEEIARKIRNNNLSLKNYEKSIERYTVMNEKRREEMAQINKELRECRERLEEAVAKEEILTVENQQLLAVLSENLCDNMTGCFKHLVFEKAVFTELSDSFRINEIKEIEKYLWDIEKCEDADAFSALRTKFMENEYNSFTVKFAEGRQAVVLYENKYILKVYNAY